MKLILIFLRSYFKIMSRLDARLAAKQAFKLFQKPRNRPFKKREKKFYDSSETFVAQSDLGDIICYEKGDPYGEVVLLVHGWDSNAGSMSGIGNVLALEGFHIISFDLPAHGKSSLKYSNLHACKIALEAVLKRVKPFEPVSVIAHSFGSAVSGYTFSSGKYKIKNLVYLASPNRIKTIFTNYKEMISLGDEAYQLMVNAATEILSEPVEGIVVMLKTRQIDYEKATLIHDCYDKILPYENSARMAAFLPRSELISFEHIGHYRMLWNTEVIEKIVKIMKPTANPLEINPFGEKRLAVSNLNETNY